MSIYEETKARDRANSNNVVPSAWGRHRPAITDATLTAFRNLADAMLGPDRDWEWIGPHPSQRMFGITRDRAEDYARRHGGVARVDMETFKKQKGLRDA